MHPKMTATNFGKNSAKGSDIPIFLNRATIDTPNQVAKKIAELIHSEDAEAEM